MRHQTEQLIAEAQEIMRGSHDAYHDLSHVTRVVGHCEKIADSFALTEVQREALILAAWWHDVSRTIMKRPSFIILTCIDDTLSALMLWMATIRLGLFGEVVGLSTKIIFCKSMGTGRFTKHLFLRKKNRVLVDILADADKLDITSLERNVELVPMVETSWIYTFGFKLGSWWLFSHKAIRLKTEEAQTLFEQLLSEMVQWLSEDEIYTWYVDQFGKRFTDRQINHIVELREECLHSF